MKKVSLDENANARFSMTNAKEGEENDEEEVLLDLITLTQQMLYVVERDH